MPIQSSISRAGDWARIRREGRSGRCDGLRVVVARREDGDLPSRVGIRVRVVGNARAVRRNRARRRLREAWRALPPPRGIDAALYADPSSLDKNFQELVGELSCALDRALGGDSP